MIDVMDFHGSARAARFKDFTIRAQGKKILPQLGVLTILLRAFWTDLAETDLAFECFHCFGNLL